VDATPQPDAITYQVIGVVRSPFTTFEGMPLQSVAAPDVHGQIEIHPSFVPGLADLETFSHLYVIAHLHRGKPGGLTVVPFLDDTRRGVFATRSPRHPNPIGVSVVRLLAVRGATLEIAGLDLLDGTPVLDIKPYVPAFDAVKAERTGWLEQGARRVFEVRADARFDEESAS
jgi:tRNA-Thr(GGU) m(6)t(6)A37 methyltransferase TsaA